MDAFEQLAADILWNDGYWVRTSVRVLLTPEDKQRIGRPSSPRWELDLVAYSARANELLVLECKSYLDSGGVHAADLLPGAKNAKRFKLFHDDVLRDTVLDRLRIQSVERGFCPTDVTVRLGMIYGHASPRGSELLTKMFKELDLLLFGPPWLRDRLGQMAAAGYENSTAAVVAKLLKANLALPADAIVRRARSSQPKKETHPMPNTTNDFEPEVACIQTV